MSSDWFVQTVLSRTVLYLRGIDHENEIPRFSTPLRLGPSTLPLSVEKHKQNRSLGIETEFKESTHLRVDLYKVTTTTI